MLNLICRGFPEAGKTYPHPIKVQNRITVITLLMTLALVMILLQATPVFSAGTIQLPTTGQKLCYNGSGSTIPCACTGQDGELQAGVALTTRFQNNGDGTVTDLQTGLMWLKDPNCILTKYSGFDTDWNVDGAVMLVHARAFLTGINNGTYPNCAAGYSDWRLPNRAELASVFNYSALSVSWLYNQGGFNFTYSLPPYWSSTARASSLGTTAINNWTPGLHGYYGSTYSGYAANGDNYNNFLWPVRSGPNGSVNSGFPANVAKTGQTACTTMPSAGVVDTNCSGTGLDGELQWGVTWPNPRFTNPDGTSPASGGVILDQLTGLMWTASWYTPGPAACGPGETKTWQAFLDYVACLNNNKYLGYSDWRMPNIAEGASLYHAGQSDNHTWLAQQGFAMPQGYYYFTSTSVGPSGSTINADKAWVFCPDTGDIGDSEKTSVSYGMAVRGGNVTNTPSDSCWASVLADVSVSAVAASSSVAAGGSIQYTVTVTNQGPNSATGVVLVNSLPATATYVSATPGQGSCQYASSQVTCSLGTLASGGSTTININATAPSASVVLTNTAAISATSRDEDTSNNSNTVYVSVASGSVSAPTVTTAAISSITTTTAASGGTVSSDGGATVTARGVCWSTLANPTTADTCTTNSTGTGAFTSMLTGLTENTDYHVRAYATNSVNTAYGNDVSFSTLSSSSLITLTLTPSETTLSVKAGESVATNLTVSASDIPANDVTFSCTGLPAGASCNFSPSSATGDQLPLTVTVTIQTATSTAAAAGANDAPWFLAMMVPGFVLIPAAKRNRRLGLKMAFVALLIIISGFTGCNCSGSGSTSAGTHNVTVTATSTGTNPAVATVYLNVTQ